MRGKCKCLRGLQYTKQQNHPQCTDHHPLTQLEQDTFHLHQTIIENKCTTQPKTKKMKTWESQKKKNTTTSHPHAIQNKLFAYNQSLSTIRSTKMISAGAAEEKQQCTTKHLQLESEYAETTNSKWEETDKDWKILESSTQSKYHVKENLKICYPAMLTPI